MIVTRRSVITTGFAALVFFPCAGGGWFDDMVEDLDETTLTFAFDGAADAKFDGEYRWLQ